MLLDIILLLYSLCFAFTLNIKCILCRFHKIHAYMIFNVKRNKTDSIVSTDKSSTKGG